MHRRVLLISAAAFGAAISFDAWAGPKVSTDVAPGANFGAYKTFNWVNATAPANMDPVAYGRIVQDIESALEAKGYMKGSPADLSLVLSLGALNKTQVNSWGYFGRQLDVYQYTEGKLSLDAFDSKTKQAVWHGQADDEIHPDKPNPAKIDSAISKLMTKFPGSGGS
jgi:hypothetical protein